MSDDADTARRAGSGSGIGFGTILRLLFIWLGIFAAVAFVSQRFGLSSTPYVDALINVFEQWLAVQFFAIEPIVKRAFAVIGVNLQLYPHYREVFVLLWLLFASIARSGRTLWRLHGNVLGVRLGYARCAWHGSGLRVGLPRQSNDDGLFWNWNDVVLPDAPRGRHFGRALPGAVAIADWCGLALAILQLTSVPPFVAVTAYIGLLGMSFTLVGLVQGAITTWRQRGALSSVGSVVG